MHLCCGAMFSNNEKEKNITVYKYCTKYEESTVMRDKDKISDMDRTEFE